MLNIKEIVIDGKTIVVSELSMLRLENLQKIYPDISKVLQGGTKDFNFKIINDLIWESIKRKTKDLPSRDEFFDNLNQTDFAELVKTFTEVMTKVQNPT